MTFPELAGAVTALAIATGVAARLTRQYFAAAVAGSSLILLVHAWGYFTYTSDDAYISYRYARHLADGLGLVWNPGDHVEGYSNFLWVVILAAFHKAGTDIVQTARWLGLALAVVAMAGTYALTRDLFSGPGSRAAALASTLLLASAGTFALWSTAGLETSLMAVLVLAAAMLHIRESDGTRLPVSGAVWALAAMTRPDAPLFFAVSGAFKIGEAYWRVRDTEGDAPSAIAREVKQLATWGAGFLVLFVPYFAWRYATYGYLFANTYYAKVGSGIDQYERGTYYLAIFSREYAAWLLAIVPVAMALSSLRRLASAYVLALLLAWFAYLVYVGGDSLVRFRLFAPLAPLMYASLCASGAALIGAVKLERPPPRYVTGGAISAAVLALMLFTLQSSATDPSVPLERGGVDDRVAIGRWLHETMAGDTSVAVIPAGAIPYESQLVTIDMLGINDEHIAHRDLPLGYFAAGHEKYDSEYVLNRQPDIILLVDALDAAPRDRGAYAGLMSGVILARIDMLNTPRLWDEYQARSVEIAEGKWLNLLVRNDASDVLSRTGAP